MNDQLTGELGYVFLVSILDAALLSWLALAWYRRSVTRLMRERAPQGTNAVAAPVRNALAPESHAGTPGPLRFEFLDESRSVGPAPAVPAPPVNLRRLAFAYCLGAALHSAVITTLQMRLEASSTPVVAWFAEWWINTWPVVPTLVVLLVLDRPARLRVGAWYVGAGSIAVALITLALQMRRGAVNSAPLTNVFWMLAGVLWAAMVPLALFLITGWRRIRAVTPLALAATLLFGFGSIAFREALLRGFNLPSVRSAILELAVLTSTEVSQYGLFMLASLPVGWVAWRLLRGLATGFGQKRFSDVQLIIDCLWVVVTADEIATSLARDYGVGGVAGGVFAFCAYRVAVALVLRSWRPQGDTASGRRLLLLRVFGYEARTESLFDRVAQRWRLHGPVQLIAGADLATRTADPGDMLSFINGQLAAQYISTVDDVPRRIQQLDFGRDPDGRHRVNEMYCRDDTWRAALGALLDVTDTVLMDLRSFSAQNSGCVFELQQLLRRVPSDHIVLACDHTTDLPLLGTIMGDAWSAARADGCAQGSGQVALVRMNGTERREFGILMQRLLGVGQPTKKDGDAHEHRALL